MGYSLTHHRENSLLETAGSTKRRELKGQGGIKVDAEIFQSKSSGIPVRSPLRFELDAGEWGQGSIIYLAGRAV